MSHVSKRKLDERTKLLLLDALNSLFTNLNKTEADKVLSTLLSDTERLMISKRIGTSLLIKEKVTESQIAESLKITRVTVDKYILTIKAGNKESWDFVLNKLSHWHEFSNLKGILKKAGTGALKSFSRGMAGRV